MISQAATSVASLVSWDLYTLPYRTLVNERQKTKINCMYHVLITNIQYNQLNDVIENELKFDSSNSLSNNPVNDTLSIVTLSLIFSKNIYIN